MPLVYNRSIKRNVDIDSFVKTEETKSVSTTLQTLIDTTRKLPTNNTEKSDIDLVYIVRPGEINHDLRYSLRSVAKFCTYRYIWIVGFKPNWVINTKYIKTEQLGNKWKNSMLNYEAACKCKEISENFVLMNDDFFAIRPIRDWETECNACQGTLEEAHSNFINIKNRSKWQYGFEYAIDLLNELGIKNHYNYELHMPMIINKNNFMNMLEMPEIKSFNSTNKVFHKRSLYKNMYPDNSTPRIIKDVKLELYKDLNEDTLSENWISTYDDCVNNKSYPKLNNLLTKLFPKPCKYEKIF